MVCGPIESERKVSGPGREDSIKNWEFHCLLHIYIYVYMTTQTELICSVLRYLYLCHPILRGQTDSFSDLRKYDDNDNL